MNTVTVTLTLPLNERAANNSGAIPFRTLAGAFR